MKLLNFSIGQVQTVKIGSELIKTAHVKSSIAEPWIITENGAEGDQRAVHPDKIYAYSRTGYDYWGAYFEVDPMGWPDGFFGENLTFDTLDEDDLRIGDVFAVGADVRLVVAGPRNPCLKLSWRLGQPPTFQKIFAKSHHTGVYFDVLQSGRVAPGDAARRIEHDPTMPSVVDVSKFAAGHATPPLEPLRRVLDFPHLSGTIRLILSAKLQSAERAAEITEGRWRGWRPFVVQRIVEEAPDINSFYLHPVDGKPVCQPRPGQFVSVRMVGAEGQTITRCWSLSTFANTMDHYRLTVRRQTGPGSNWLHRSNLGSTVSLRPPTGNFTLDLGGFRPVVLVAAGIGITPLLAMLHAHVSRGITGTPIYLIYGARTPGDVAFRRELEAISREHPTLKITYVYSQSYEGGRPAGRISADLVVEALADNHIDLGDRRIPLPWYEADVYICGPGEFSQSLKSDFVARGANADHILMERFSAPETTSDLDSAEVFFQRSGVRCTWAATEDLTLLELAEKMGITKENDCRAGACLTCKTMVLEGAATVGMEDGATLLCIGRPKTSSLTLDC